MIYKCLREEDMLKNLSYDLKSLDIDSVCDFNYKKIQCETKLWFRFFDPTRMEFMWKNGIFLKTNENENEIIVQDCLGKIYNTDTFAFENKQDAMRYRTDTKKIVDSNRRIEETVEKLYLLMKSGFLELSELEEFED